MEDQRQQPGSDAGDSEALGHPHDPLASVVQLVGRKGSPRRLTLRSPVVPIVPIKRRPGLQIQAQVLSSSRGSQPAVSRRAESTRVANEVAVAADAPISPTKRSRPFVNSKKRTLPLEHQQYGGQDEGHFDVSAVPNSAAHTTKAAPEDIHQAGNRTKLLTTTMQRIGDNRDILRCGCTP